MIIPITLSADHSQAEQDIQYLNCKVFTVRINKVEKTCCIHLIGEIYFHNPMYAVLCSLLMSATEDYTIYFNIHSPGGAISTACNIIAAMNMCKAKIITRNMGLAASCGSLILAFGNKIEIMPNAVTMFHSSSSGYMPTISQRILTQTSHLVDYTKYLLTIIQKKGLILQEEFDDITNNAKEFYLSSEVMIPRIESAGLLYKEAV